jgi:hypothetical protein
MKYQTYPAYKASGVSLVPTQRVGTRETSARQFLEETSHATTD